MNASKRIANKVGTHSKSLTNDATVTMEKSLWIGGHQQKDRGDDMKKINKKT